MTTAEDTSKSITLVATDIDSTALTYSIVSGPSHGTISGGTGATRTYTPTANYNGPDSFTFRAYDGTAYSNTATVSITVTAVNDPPVAQANGPYSGSTGRPVSFSSAGSSDPDGTISSYLWNFGDGTTGTGANPSHTYATGGPKTVTLTVTDNNGGTNSDTATATINWAPVADAGGPYTGTAGENVSVTGSGSSDSDGSISSYSWNWGDGTANSSGVAAIHKYTSSGSYTITLTVTDNLGITDTDTAAVTVAANAKPTVKVTAPAGTGLISGPLTVRIQATDVESAAGTLTVQYRFDGAAFKTATYNSFTQRYEGTVDSKTLTDGSHTVTARATDGFGNTTTSSSVGFVVDNNEPPKVSITSPVTNSTVTGSVKITANATDDKAVSKVEFFLDGVRIGTDSSSSGGWTFTWDSTNAKSGSHALTATAFDGAGKKGSGGVFVTVDQPPTVDITSPRAGAVVKERVTIGTSAKDDIKVAFVEFFVDGVRLGADTNSSAGWSFSWNTREVDNGRHTILVLAQDSNGQKVTTSIQVTVDNDLAPNTTITSPRSGSTIYGVGIVQIAATATDEEGVVQVEFFVDGTSIGVDNTSSNGWTAVWNAVRATIGSHTIRAVATDTLGQTAADTNQVTIQAFTTPTTLAPASTTTVTFVEVDTPAQGLSATAFSLEPPTVSAGGEIALTVALSAEIPGKANVQFLLDGEPLGDVATVNAVEASLATAASAVFTRTLPTGVPVGLHRVEAVTTDQPPTILASRTVGVIAGETPDSGEAIPPPDENTGTSTGSSPPVGVTLALVVGGIAALAAAGFGATGWYRRKVIVRRLAARGR